MSGTEAEDSPLVFCLQLARVCELDGHSGFYER